METLYLIILKHPKLSWNWKTGDIFWIDNRQVMHSRNHFTGPRKVLASLWVRHQDEVFGPQMIGCLERKPNYLDLYLIHFPISLDYLSLDQKYPPEWVNLNQKMVLQPQDLSETWKAMEELYRQKLVKSIGVSNFNSSLLRQIINSSSIPPEAIQIELHPYLSQERMLTMCRQLQIPVIAYSPLGAKSYIELEMATSLQDLCSHQIILQLSQQHGKSPVQILLRWAIQRKTIPICKSSSEKHMIENLDIFDFSLSLGEMESIGDLNQNLRFNDPGKFCLEAFGTFCPIYD